MQLIGTEIAAALSERKGHWKLFCTVSKVKRPQHLYHPLVKVVRFFILEGLKTADHLPGA